MLDHWVDQADGLRRLLSKTPPQIVTLCSAISEPGRPWALLNLAAALREAGVGVLIVDAAVGQDGGLLAEHREGYELQDVLHAQCTLAEAIHNGPEDIPVICAHSGVEGLVTALTENQTFLGQLQLFSEGIEILLVNTVPDATGAQCSDELLSQEMVITVRPERASVAETYRLIQSLCERSSQREFRLLVSGKPSIREAQKLHRALSQALDRALDLQLTLLGIMPSDRYLREAASEGRTVVIRNPNTVSASSFRRMADSLIRCRAVESQRLGISPVLTSKTPKSRAFSSLRG